MYIIDKMLNMCFLFFNFAKLFKCISEKVDEEESTSNLNI